MEKIVFEVMGNPKALKRHRTGKFCNYDPSMQDKQDFLILAHNNRPSMPIDGPLKIDIEFCFARPKNHYGSGKNSKILKPGCGLWHIARPDTDNLIKFVCDSLNGVFFKDDSQLCEIRAVKKYSEKPRTIVIIERA